MQVTIQVRYPRRRSGEISRLPKSPVRWLGRGGRSSGRSAGRRRMKLSRPPQVFRSLLQDGDLCIYRVEVSKSPRSRGLQGFTE